MQSHASSDCIWFQGGNSEKFTDVFPQFPIRKDEVVAIRLSKWEKEEKIVRPTLISQVL